MRGYEKRVFLLKGTDGGIFEEAIFLVKDGEAAPDVSQNDMISEANRIIEESLGGRQPRRIYRRGSRASAFFTPFLLGALLAAVSAALLALFT